MCLERSSMQAEVGRASRHPNLQAESGRKAEPPLHPPAPSPSAAARPCAGKPSAAGERPLQGGLTRRLCSLQTLPSPLPFLFAAAPVLAKRMHWMERASRACVHACCARPPACVRVRVCVCVLQPTSLKQSQPRAAEARQPSISWPAPAGSQRCLRARALAAQGSSIPAAAAGPAARPGERGRPGGSWGLPKMEPAGGSWLPGSN